MLACKFHVGQLVTCDGPFNRGRDAEGYWRRVEVVVNVRWNPAFRGFKGRVTPGFWRVDVAGLTADERSYEPAPEGYGVGDLIR